MSCVDSKYCRELVGLVIDVEEVFRIGKSNMYRRERRIVVVDMS